MLRRPGPEELHFSVRLWFWWLHTTRFTWWMEEMDCAYTVCSSYTRAVFRGLCNSPGCPSLFQSVFRFVPNELSPGAQGAILCLKAHHTSANYQSEEMRHECCQSGDGYLPGSALYTDTSGPGLMENVWLSLGWRDSEKGGRRGEWKARE